MVSTLLQQVGFADKPLNPDKNGECDVLVGK